MAWILFATEAATTSKAVTAAAVGALEGLPKVALQTGERTRTAGLLLSLFLVLPLGFVPAMVEVVWSKGFVNVVVMMMLGVWICE